MNWGKEIFNAGVSVRSRLVHGGIASVVLKIISVAANLVVTVLLARLLAPDGYGVYTLALTAVSLVGVPIQLGLPTLVLREVTVLMERQEWGLLRGLIRWAHQVVIGSSLGIGAIVIAITWIFKAQIGVSALQTTLIAAPVLAIGALTSIRQSILMGMKRVMLAQIPELLLLPVLYLGCLLPIFLSHHPVSPQSVMSLYVGCYLSIFIIGSFLMAKNLPAEVSSATPQSLDNSWLRGILPLSLISGFSILSAQLIILILGAISTSENVGLYRVAASGAAMTTIVGATIGNIVAPYIATFYNQGDRRKLQLLATYSAWACIVPALVVLVTFGFIGDSILRFAFGEKFVAAEGALIVLTIGQVINCGTGIVHSLLVMTGHERDTLRGVAVGTITNVIIALALVPHFGLIGAAAATCIAVAAENVLLYTTVQTRLKIASSIFPVSHAWTEQVGVIR